MREEEKKLIEARVKGPLKFYGVCRVSFKHKAGVPGVQTPGTKEIHGVETLYLDKADALDDIKNRQEDDRFLNDPNIQHYFILEYQGDLTLPGYTEIGRICNLK